LPEVCDILIFVGGIQELGTHERNYSLCSTIILHGIFQQSKVLKFTKNLDCMPDQVFVSNWSFYVLLRVDGVLFKVWRQCR